MTGEQAELVEAVLRAYSRGWFPMADSNGRFGPGGIHWFSPDPRAILPLEPGRFHVPRTLRSRVRSGRFTIRTDTAFAAVIRACAQPRPSPDPALEGTWIDEQIIDAYCLLHRAGHAHSIEAWLPAGQHPDRDARDDPNDSQDRPTLDASGTHVLVGGLYGVHVGGLFAGESMFSRPRWGGTDSSKVCLVHLVDHLRRRGFTLLDTQFRTEHLDRFGCTEIEREQYLRRLGEAVGQTTTWLPFDPDLARESLSRTGEAGGVGGAS